MPNPNKEPPASSKAPNEDLKDIEVLCNFKIKIENQNSDHGCIKPHWPSWNQDQDAKPQSRSSRVLQSPKWGLKGHGCSLHLHNLDREPKFGERVPKIKIKVQNPNQEPPASSEAPNPDFKDMDVLCTFKIKIGSQKSDHRCTKDKEPYPNKDPYAKP